jgi:imidazoleglycerol-phosphate dehydratase
MESAAVKPRTATIHRRTKETSIDVTLNVDGRGAGDFDTGIGFLDHLLDHLSKHGLFDITVHATGDLRIDPHHTVEDVAITLGKAFDEALDGRKGIARMSDATVPMDESLASVAVDISGRGYSVVEAAFSSSEVGGMPTTLIRHFLESFAREAKMNIYARVLSGYDDHHKAEALFKALARALDGATRLDKRRLEDVPSTKGVI